MHKSWFPRWSAWFEVDYSLTPPAPRNSRARDNTSWAKAASDYQSWLTGRVICHSSFVFTRSLRSMCFVFFVGISLLKLISDFRHLLFLPDPRLPPMWSLRWPEPTCRLLSQFMNCTFTPSAEIAFENRSLGGGFKWKKKFIPTIHLDLYPADSPDFVHEHFTCSTISSIHLFVKHLYCNFEYFVCGLKSSTFQWSLNGTTLLVSRVEQTCLYARFLGNCSELQGFRISKLPHLLLPMVFSPGRKTKNMTWSFVYNSDLLLMCGRLTGSAFPGSWKLQEYSEPREFAGVSHALFDGNGNNQKSTEPYFVTGSWLHFAKAFCQCQLLVSQESLWPKPHINGAELQNFRTREM